jgi:peroxiredoxin
LIGVNITGHDARKLKAVMDKENLTWRSFADPGELGQGAIAARWNLAATPTLYVIDPKGVIRHKWLGSPGEKAIDTALEKLIKEAEGTGKDPP